MYEEEKVGVENEEFVDETLVCKECGKELPIEMFKMTRWGTRTEVCTPCARAKAEANKLEKQRLAQQEKEINEKTARQLRLQDFSPRELMLELKRRGYEGMLTYLEPRTVDISKLDE